jgi:hypothetical protein
MYFQACCSLPQELASLQGGKMPQLGMAAWEAGTLGQWFALFAVCSQAAEIMEYTDLLDKADTCADPHER